MRRVLATTSISQPTGLETFPVLLRQRGLAAHVAGIHPARHAAAAASRVVVSTSSGTPSSGLMERAPDVIGTRQSCGKQERANRNCGPLVQNAGFNCKTLVRDRAGFFARNFFALFNRALK